MGSEYFEGHGVGFVGWFELQPPFLRSLCLRIANRRVFVDVDDAHQL